MKYYLAGKISGNPNYKQDFAEAEKTLRKILKNPEKVIPILSPAVLPEGMSKADYMRICFAMVESSDCVILLSNATESEGLCPKKDTPNISARWFFALMLKMKGSFNRKNAPNSRDAFPKRLWNFYKGVDLTTEKSISRKN